MIKSDWRGVMPAVTTPFLPDGSVDHEFLAKHIAWLMDHRATGLVPLGSLGEGGTLTAAEKREVLKTAVASTGGKPVVAGISAMSTAEAVSLAQDAEALGCQGLMVLPPYVYPGDRREISAHMSAVIEATALSCMLYNNPIAYGIDFTPEWAEELAAKHENLHSMKESSADVRRIHELRRRLGDRLALFVGVDDVALEGFQAGAVGWIAGLVNAFPAESQALFDHAQAGRTADAEAIYHWFLPLLRLDVVPKFVQLIKLTQQEVGWGSESVRAPRLALEGAEREAALAIIREGVANRP
jgi:4-hydroxy-tetrahydrodipicolinate synthase